MLLVSYQPCKSNQAAFGPLIVINVPGGWDLTGGLNWLWLYASCVQRYHIRLLGAAECMNFPQAYSRFLFPNPTTIRTMILWFFSMQSPLLWENRKELGNPVATPTSSSLLLLPMFIASFKILVDFHRKTYKEEFRRWCVPCPAQDICWDLKV